MEDCFRPTVHMYEHVNGSFLQNANIDFARSFAEFVHCGLQKDCLGLLQKKQFSIARNGFFGFAEPKFRSVAISSVL